MARKAFISSDMAHDEKLFDVAQESSLAALIFPMLITYFDDWGRAEGNPFKIKASVFPNIPIVTVELIKNSLFLFEKYGLIILYEIGGIKYIAMPSFMDLQSKYALRPSRHPDPPPTSETAILYISDCYSRRVKENAVWLKHRLFVYERDGRECVYCGSNEKLSIDHVFPRSRGGTDDPQNLVTACMKCNLKKSSKTPEEAGMRIGGKIRE